MSPVRVKLGDFGASKWIQAPATTTLHTQVSTPLYRAPEVQGLDSNSETSIYTNSVDIWSLGCVIYELLGGTKFIRLKTSSLMLLDPKTALSRRKANTDTDPNQRCWNLSTHVYAINTTQRSPDGGGCTEPWVVGGPYRRQ